MNRFLCIVCILFSGYANSQVAHPENPDIVGTTAGSFGNDVCFNNDGTIVDTEECSDPLAAEGYVYVNSTEWRGGLNLGINGCGATSVDPVTNAACPFTTTTFASCTPNQYVLVQTISSGHYFAIRAGDTCGVFNRPETEVIFPCLSTDSFHPVTGCASADPSEVSIDGYIKLDVNNGTHPPDAHCEDTADVGRMAVDDVNLRIYVCTQFGWSSTSLTPP